MEYIQHPDDGDFQWLNMADIWKVLLQVLVQLAQYQLGDGRISHNFSNLFEWVTNTYSNTSLIRFGAVQPFDD